MRSCIARSYVVIVVSLLLLAGVASSERLRGVCKEGCSDLSDEESCEAEESKIPERDDLPTIANTNGLSRQSCQSCRTSDCRAPNSSAPELNIELQHYSYTEFGIAVTWGNVINDVTAVYVILSEWMSDECNEVPPHQTEPPFHYQCASFNSTGPDVVRFTYYYRHSNAINIVRDHLYVTVITYFQNGCNAATEKMVTIPKNCHIGFPGSCSLCGKNDETIPRPGGIAVSPCQRMSDGIWEVSISWDNTCAHCIYYLTIFNERMRNGTVAQLKVLGERDSVILQGLPAQQTYSVQLQLYDCQCVNSRDTVEFFLGSSLHPTPSTQIYTSSMMSITMVESSASESLLCQPTSSPPSWMPSTQTPVVHPSTSTQVQSPTPTSTPTSHPNTGDAVQFVAIFVPVGVMIVLVIIIAVLVVVMRRKFNRPPKPKEEDSSKGKGFPTGLESRVQNTESEPQRESDPLRVPDPAAHSISETDSKPDHQYRVLVVYSSLTPQNQEASIHRFMAKLCCHGIEPHFSQKGQYRRRTVEWIQQMVVECDAVICICNEQFRHEWDGRVCHNSPVRFVREIIYGSISKAKPNNLSKYVLMTIQPSDIQECIPSYIGSCKICSPLDSNTAVDDVVRFIKQLPKYQFQTNR